MMAIENPDMAQQVIELALLGGVGFAIYHFATNAKKNGAPIGPGSTTGGSVNVANQLNQGNQAISDTYAAIASAYQFQYGGGSLGPYNGQIYAQ